MFHNLEEAIAIASEPGTASRAGFANGFLVEEGFENAGFILPGGEGQPLAAPPANSLSERVEQVAFEWATRNFGREFRLSN